MRRFGFLAFLFFAAALTTVSAVAEASTKADKGFRHYFALELEGNASYYLFTFTPEVHQAIKAPDGRDVRIIDADGKPVPYAFGGGVKAKEETPIELTRRSAPWFPLPRTQGGKSVQDGFIIAADGALRVRERQIEAEHRNGDIVDLSGIFGKTEGEGGEQRDEKKHPGLNALFVHIDASTGGTGEYLGTVEVLASNDLQSWYSVTTAQLLRLDHHGQRLERERIDFDGALLGKSPRYLQLCWRTAPPVIANVEAELLPPQSDIDAAKAQQERQRELRYWKEKLSGQMLPDGEVLFDTDGVFPVDRLRFHLPHPNTVVPVKLYSRADENASWRLIGRETLYRLQGSDGLEQETPETKIAPNRDRFWRVVVESDDRQSGAGKRKESGKRSPEFGGTPQLSIGWRPETVTFLAHGTPPFLLAAGHAQATDASIPLARLLVGEKPYLAAARVGMAQSAPANAPVASSGAEALSKEKIRRAVLWGVLLAVVALLAFMAWKLARHLPQGETGKEDERG
ncbi:MAG: DUF3999 domain-containing protein [Proteobacteria bacterium]|nr:DUF3999 domain-containing protein [Pseudomonadota bacterium]MCL2307981.1 DUF3999 domain-containing protein [Pseudomonadota bacterium]